MAQPKFYQSYLNGNAQKGRTQLIRDVVNELSPEGKAEVDALVEYIVKWVKQRNPRAFFSTDAALEVVWQMLIYEDDPLGKGADWRMEKYLERYVQMAEEQ